MGANDKAAATFHPDTQFPTGGEMTSIIEELRSGPHSCPICNIVHTSAVEPCKHTNTHMRGWIQVCDDCGLGRDVG